MDVLVIGSGGREHTLVWKIAQSQEVDKIYCTPGNAGICGLAECVQIKADDLNGLLDFALRKNIGLTVVGPEVPLTLGIVDAFKQNGLHIFGPDKSASRLESSKIFAKNLMRESNIPSADFYVFSDYQKALDFVNLRKQQFVIKADGLCAGKGVFVCPDLDSQHKALKAIMQDKIFKDAGDKVIIEEKLEGREVSVLVISDGENILPLASSQDYKTIFENGQGPNTGGMGAYSPCVNVGQELFVQIEDTIIKPVLKTMAMQGNPFQGVLYTGIMLTAKGPYVLEFNIRFGDPETQVILPRLKTDLAKVMLAAVQGNLADMRLQWDSRACVCVVLASSGYPASYERDKQITGLEDLKTEPDVFVFHAGTKKVNSQILTNGGRVLGVSALGEDITAAADCAYKAIGRIKFENMYLRKDIGKL
ncbi:MAG: phosphoribosylamine--glycine ligase [Candidatus Omnitrophota bacterium]|nr:MAG: phosphoribosylamine--glycine ligase [Candidatus Omnitrophota bacterium]